MTVNNDTPPKGAGFNILRAVLGVLNSIFNLVLPKPKKLMVNSGEAEKARPIAPATPSQVLSASEPASDKTRDSAQTVTTNSESGGQHGGSAPHGHSAPELKPGWVSPKPEHIPLPTYWPVVMAAGITLLAFGVVTSLIVSAVGAFLFVLALVGWIGDIRNEQRENHKH